MGIYIKGMTMPSCCDVCRFSDWSNLHQTACCKMRDYDPCFEDHSMDNREKRADFCPLVEIPEPYGRLVDDNAMYLALAIIMAGALTGGERNADT